MVDLEIMKQWKSGNDALKRLFTAEQPSNYKKLPKEKQEEIDKLIEKRKRIEDLVGGRLTDSLNFNLSNHQMLSAVDLAWDSVPINKGSYPLMLYAQDKLNLGDCATSLTKAGLSKYVVKSDKGEVIGIDLPKFYETTVNLIRSILTRRHAAQSNKYNNLWPHFKYESRSTSQVGKLRADIMSQRMDIMADQFDYRHFDSQVIREMLMYAHVVAFVRSAWEKEQQIRRKRVPPGTEVKDGDTEAFTVKEGLAFVNPHPSRVFWDNNYPLASLNTDTGIEWVGYWDVVRYKDIANNTEYWNRDKVHYSTNVTSLFSVYASYFNQYYCTITPPCPKGTDLTSWNERKNNIGIYSGDEGDSSMIKAEFFWKIKPSDWGIGDYPHPVWTRLIVGGDNTILFAEFLPSTPGAVCSHNENDNRQTNISFAHELMGYQDQLTNLLSYLLLCISSDNIKLIIIDTDTCTSENVKKIRDRIQCSQAYDGPTVVEISRSKADEIGYDPAKAVQLVETKSAALDAIFRAIGQLIQLVERMAALSPQEQGQPAPREISATETNLIAGTTESVYGFISDSIDEYRAAKKRICCESYLAMGDQDFRVPVINRYSKQVIEGAGFQMEEGEFDYTASSQSQKISAYTILGSKDKLEHDYIFTTRDGAERPVNTQAANALVQLLNVILKVPQVLQALKKDQLYEMFNEVFRQSGAGVDLKLEVQEGEDNMLSPDPEEKEKELEGILKLLTDHVEKNSNEIAAIKPALEQLIRQSGAQAPQIGMAPAPPQIAA